MEQVNYSTDEIRELKEIFSAFFIKSIIDKYQGYEKPIKDGTTGTLIRSVYELMFSPIPIFGPVLEKSCKLIQATVNFARKQNRNFHMSKLQSVIYTSLPRSVHNKPDNINELFKIELYPIAQEIAHIFEKQLTLSKGSKKERVKYVCQLAAVAANRCMHELVHNKNSIFERDFILYALIKENKIGHKHIGVNVNGNDLIGCNVFLKAGIRYSNARDISYHQGVKGYKRKYGKAFDVYDAIRDKKGNFIRFSKKPSTTAPISDKQQGLTLQQDINKQSNNGYYKLTIDIDGQDLQDYITEVHSKRSANKDIPTLNSFIKSRYNYPNDIQVICRSLQHRKNGKMVTIKDLSYGRFDGVIFDYLDLRDSNLTGADFQFASLFQCNLQNCIVTNASFKYAMLCAANMVNIREISGVDFEKAFVSLLRLGNTGNEIQDLSQSKLEFANKYELLNLLGEPSKVKLPDIVKIKISKIMGASNIPNQSYYTAQKKHKSQQANQNKPEAIKESAKLIRACRATIVYSHPTMLEATKVASTNAIFHTKKLRSSI